MLLVCKSLAKSIVDGLLTVAGVGVYHLGLAPLVIRLNRRSPKVLMYHSCEPAESDFTRGLSINTTPSQFAAHLSFLARYYRVASLSELIGRTPEEPTVAITFDDGFQSVYRNAWPQLRERNFTATCYLVTDVIDNGELIWLNELNWFLHRHGPIAMSIISAELGLDHERHLGAIVRLVQDRYDQVAVAGLLARLRSVIGVDPRTVARTDRVHLGWNEIAEMAAAGMDFGNHTVSHPPLASLPLPSCVLARRFARPRRRLSHLPGGCRRSGLPVRKPDRSDPTGGPQLGVLSLLEVEGVDRPLDPTRVLAGSRLAPSPRLFFFRAWRLSSPVKSRLKKWAQLATPSTSSWLRHEIVCRPEFERPRLML